MSTYSMDMSQEKEPNRKVLFPKGWREFEIINAKESVSKAGNKQMIFTVEDVETEEYDEIYAIMTEGKRWKLKQILNAVGCEGGQDGVYNWELSDVLGKRFMGLVEHKTNNWIDRDGLEHKDFQHDIQKFKKVEGTPVNESVELNPTEGWDDK